MKRVAVITSASGNGGTTFARRLASRLGAPFVELDALHYGPDWSKATAEELQARVRPIVASDAWVIDGSYRGKLGDLVLERAELVVWLDLPMYVWLPRSCAARSRASCGRKSCGTGTARRCEGRSSGVTRSSRGRSATTGSGVAPTPSVSPASTSSDCAPSARSSAF